MAGWREGGRLRKVYLGSCRKMSQDEALQKARVMKAKVLDKASSRPRELSESREGVGS